MFVYDVINIIDRTKEVSITVFRPNYSEKHDPVNINSRRDIAKRSNLDTDRSCLLYAL